MAAAFRALVRDTVPYANDGAPRLAKLGEYGISRCGEDAIAFHGASDFTLSLDALCQHLSEGRISLIGGRALPA